MIDQQKIWFDLTLAVKMMENKKKGEKDFYIEFLHPCFSVREKKNMPSYIRRERRLNLRETNCRSMQEMIALGDTT